MQVTAAGGVFAAFGGWDAAGAQSFGYPTFWANRLNLPVEELADAIGDRMTDLLRFVGLPWRSGNKKSRLPIFLRERFE